MAVNDAGDVLTGVPRLGSRVYYGWVVLAVAALAMVGTLPGRTQGLGLITEPLLRDLAVDRVRFAEINHGAPRHLARRQRSAIISGDSAGSSLRGVNGEIPSLVDLSAAMP